MGILTNFTQKMSVEFYQHFFIFWKKSMKKIIFFILLITLLFFFILYHKKYSEKSVYQYGSPLKSPLKVKNITEDFQIELENGKKYRFAGLNFSVKEIKEKQEEILPLIKRLITDGVEIEREISENEAFFRCQVKIELTNSIGYFRFFLNEALIASGCGVFSKSELLKEEDQVLFKILEYSAMSNHYGIWSVSSSNYPFSIHRRFYIESFINFLDFFLLSSLSLSEEILSDKEKKICTKYRRIWKDKYSFKLYQD